MSAIIILTILIFMSSSYAASAQISNNSRTVYSYGDNSIYFDGNWAVLNVNNSTYAQSWDISAIHDGSIFTLMPNQTRTYTEQIGKEHVVIREFESTSLKLSEVYAFLGNCTEQSIVVQNLVQSNQTYVVRYHLDQSNRMNLEELGLMNNTTLYAEGQEEVIGMQNSIWGLVEGNNEISWSQSISNLAGSIMAFGTFGEDLTLVYDTGRIIYNETYTIDPSISHFPVNNSADQSGAAIYSYNDYGNLVLAGTIGLSVNGPPLPEITTTTFLFSIGTSFNANNGSAPGDDFSVNRVSEWENITGNSAGIPMSISYYLENDYFQNSDSTSPSTMSEVLQSLYDVAQVAASIYGIPLINPFAFIQHSSPDQYFTDNYSKTYDAGSAYNIRTMTTQYLGLTQNGKVAYLFGGIFNTGFTDQAYGYTYSNPLYVYFTYAATLAVTNGYPNNIASGSQSIEYTLGTYSS